MSRVAKIAYDFLKSEAIDEVAAKARRSVRSQTHKWIWDPEVSGVIGLVRRDNPRKAVVIIWLEKRDFEVDEDWLWSRPRDSGPVASTGEETEDASRKT